MLIRHKSTADFEKWEKKEYVKLAKDNPVKFLFKSESACFRKPDDGLIALNEEMERFVEDKVFIREMMDGGDIGL